MMPKDQNFRNKIKAKKHENIWLRDVSSNVSQYYKILRSYFNSFMQKWYDEINIYNSERLREYAEKYELIYVPSHRSHMDYLLLGNQLYKLGLNVPHTAAGINLNFWPIGSLLRRGGAFFLRRTFAGNRLYSDTFAEYMGFLYPIRSPLCYYPEGGRSRTGFLLPAKIGLLQMIITQAYKTKSRPICFVPVHINYDKMLEGSSYITELGGKKETS